MQIKMTAPTKPFVLGEVANEGYSGHSWGGEPDENKPTPSLVLGMNGLGVLNDGLIMASPQIKDFFAPDSQNVIGVFNINYQNVPSIEATTTITMTALYIMNSSNALVDYDVHIINSNGDRYASLTFSASPGEIVRVPNMPDISIDQSLDISVYAISGFCSSARPCYNVEHPTILTGTGNVKYNPY